MGSDSHTQGGSSSFIFSDSLETSSQTCPELWSYMIPHPVKLTMKLCHRNDQDYFYQTTSFPLSPFESFLAIVGPITAEHKSSSHYAKESFSPKWLFLLSISDFIVN